VIAELLKAECGTPRAAPSRGCPSRRSTSEDAGGRGGTGSPLAQPPTSLKEVSTRTTQVEKALTAAATRAPVEAAALIAQAQETVRAQLDDLRGAPAADPEASRDFYRSALTGLTFTPDGHKWVIEAGVDLTKERRPQGVGVSFCPVVLPVEFVA